MKIFNPFDPPKNADSRKYKILLWKRYFDTGYGLTSYLKYGIALFGLSSLNVSQTLTLGIAYGLLCFVFGWIWYRYQFVEVENEISNRFNLFAREMREMKQRVERQRHEKKPAKESRKQK